MKHLPVWFVPALLVLSLGACVKSKTETVINNDGSGTLTFKVSYKPEAIEAIRTRITEFADRADEQGRDPSRFEAQEKRLDTFVESFTPKKVQEQLEKSGLKVLGIKPFERDGYKGVLAQTSFQDINAVLTARQALRMKQQQRPRGRRAGAGGEQEGRGRRRRGFGRRFSRARANANLSLVAAFESTADPKVGKAVLIPPRAPRPERAGGGSRRGRGGAGGRFGSMMEELSLSEMSLQNIITLPGKILTVQGCRKLGPKQIALERKGGELSGRGNPGFDRATGVYATFEIPAGCKIVFQSPKPAKQTGEHKQATKKKARKGGLTIDKDG